MKTNSRVTVLIPCHSLAFFSSAVDSISQQTLPLEMFEVVIVADRVAPAEIERIMRGYEISYSILRSPNPGIVQALNLGLAFCRTEFIARMDEDDVMKKRRLELQLEFMEKRENFVAVGGQIEIIDSNNTFLRRVFYPERVRNSLRNCIENRMLAHPASMIRTSAIKKIGGYRNFVPEDWDLWLRLQELGQIGNIPQTVLSYRVHPHQLSRKAFYGDPLASMRLLASSCARKCKIADMPRVGEDVETWFNLTDKILKSTMKSYKFKLLIVKSFLRYRQNDTKKSSVAWKTKMKLIIEYPLSALAVIVYRLLMWSDLILVRLRYALRRTTPWNN